MSNFWGPLGKEFRTHPVKTAWVLMWCTAWFLLFVICTFALAAPILFLDKREEWIAFWYRMWGVH